MRKSKNKEVNPKTGRLRTKCTPDQERNPLTGRCILKTSANKKKVQALLQKPCTDPNKERSKITGRCVLKPGKKQTPKKSTPKRKSSTRKSTKKSTRKSTKKTTRKSTKKTTRKSTPKTTKKTTPSRGVNILLDMGGLENAKFVYDKSIENSKYWTPKRLAKHIGIPSSEDAIRRWQIMEGWV